MLVSGVHWLSTQCAWPDGAECDFRSLFAKLTGTLDCEREGKPGAFFFFFLTICTAPQKTALVHYPSPISTFNQVGQQSSSLKPPH